jgi:hypothetical protein
MESVRCLYIYNVIILLTYTEDSHNCTSIVSNNDRMKERSVLYFL